MAAAHHREHHTHEDLAEREAAIVDRLRAEGGRVTTGRRAVVHALLTGDDHHVAAEDIARIVQAELPDVHLSTIYRTLDTLERFGVVGRFNLGPGGAVYHLTDHVHHHLVCDSCGQVIEVPDQLFTTVARLVDERYGFEMPAHHLTIVGRCSACRVERPARTGRV